MVHTPAVARFWRGLYSWGLREAKPSAYPHTSLQIATHLLNLRCQQCPSSKVGPNMRVLLQRVSRAKVTVDGDITGEIGRGLLVLLGAGEGDTDEDLAYVLDKTVNLRIFADDDGKMNLSLKDIDAEMLVVSQFTLYADTRRGRRPSFVGAMGASQAEAMYEEFVARARQQVRNVQTGVFGAMMDVELVNDGPVTIWIDSRDR